MKKNTYFCLKCTRMFTVYKEEIQRLINNIDVLKQKLNKQSNELEQVREKNTELEIIIKEKEIITEDLKNKYQDLLHARELDSGMGGKENAKAKINTLVREIDKCIALLND